jgi:hypothetical protein
LSTLEESCVYMQILEDKNRFLSKNRVVTIGNNLSLRMEV